jgi:hypothetical protein
MSDETPAGSRTEPWVYPLLASVVPMLAMAIAPTSWQRPLFAITVLLFLAGATMLVRQLRTNREVDLTDRSGRRE